MKTLFAFFFLPALTNGILLNASLAETSPSFSTFKFWPKWKKAKRAKKYRAIKVEPTETLSYHSLMVNGARHYMAKNYAMALSNYRRALAIRPDDATALSGEAWSLYYLGQGEQAEKDFQALLKVDANDSWAREGVALCHSHANVACV